MLAYNSVREKLILKEYGRNVQDLVTHLNTIQSKEERTEKAATLVKLMKVINPATQQTPEVEQKLWDDLYIMSGFALDIDGPYPAPTQDILDKKPESVAYTSNEITYRHYGRNIELLIEKAITLKDPEAKEAAAVYIGRLMKAYAQAYNKETPEDEVICKNIRKLSAKQLDIDPEKVKTYRLFDPAKRPEKRNGRDNRSAAKGASPSKGASKSTNAAKGRNTNKRSFKGKK